MGRFSRGIAVFRAINGIIYVVPRASEDGEAAIAISESILFLWLRQRMLRWNWGQYSNQVGKFPHMRGDEAENGRKIRQQ